jgi:peptide/nickel transport system permease protein
MRGVSKSVSRTVGVVVFAVIVLLCILVPILSRYDPNAFVAPPFQPPSGEHWFGTDQVGRDLFVRTWAGGRVDIIAAIATSAVAMIVGTIIGTFAGSSRLRWLDSLIMRIVDAVIAFPLVVLVLALVVVIGTDWSWGPFPAGLIASIAGLMCVMWSGYARVARGQSLALRDSDFVLATRVSGLTNRRTVFGHIVPGVLRITLSLAVADVVLVIVILSSLPFLGAGVQPPNAEWGIIMFEGRGFLRQAPWITLIPGAVLAITGLSLSLIADSFLDNRKAK